MQLDSERKLSSLPGWHRRAVHSGTSYARRLDRSLVVVLLLLILAFLVLPKRTEYQPSDFEPIRLNIIVQDIPATRQTVRRGRPRPERPQIPLPVEDPQVPEDATIVETDIRWDVGDSPQGLGGLTANPGDTLLPRPVLQIMPDYPQEAREAGLSGIVRLLLLVDENGIVRQAIVSENTTGSAACAREAVEAARRSRYRPGRIDNRPSEVWMSCEFGFEPE